MSFPANEVAAEHLCSDQTSEWYGNLDVTRKNPFLIILLHNNLYFFIILIFLCALRAAPNGMLAHPLKTRAKTCGFKANG